MNTKCHECGATMKEKMIGKYHYKESGLDNVYLHGILSHTCLHCKETFVEIPDPVQLHIVLSLALASKTGMLIGSEIRFLRKEIGMPSKSFAQMMGVDPVTLSRWENDDGAANKPKSSDRLVRMTFKVMMCERLKAMISSYEKAIKRAQIVSFHKNTVDIRAEQMKFVTFPDQLYSYAEAGK